MSYLNPLRPIYDQNPNEPDPTSGDAADRDAVLTLIGHCWAGGELTGKALQLFGAGDYAGARNVAEAQIELQEE